ncbi:hypothetical protein GCWU000246_01075 [Jonquetella anthropi E3_33 E1]|nr:hypothetical protein GCWU000246_01075 [Jonquetella anthropi E3_33 E1]
MGNWDAAVGLWARGRFSMWCYDLPVAGVFLLGAGEIFCRACGQFRPGRA